MPGEARGRLQEHLRLLEVPRGPWEVPGGEAFRGAFGLLLVHGQILADVALDSGVGTELLGPGDLFRAWPNDDELLPTTLRLVATEPSRLAVLDGDVVGLLRHFPDVGARLLAGSVSRHRRQALHRVVAQMPRVEDRVTALLWMLAERWGRVTPEGVLLDVVLTHELLGRLVGARRSTISTALAELVEDGRVRRRADRRIVLLPGSRTALLPHLDVGSTRGDLLSGELAAVATVAARPGEPSRRPDVLLSAPRAWNRTEEVLRWMADARGRATATVVRAQELVAEAERTRAAGRRLRGQEHV